MMKVKSTVKISKIRIDTLNKVAVTALEQTAEALASAIDAKDAYTHGLPNMATTERAKNPDWYINWIVRFLDMLIN